MKRLLLVLGGLFLLLVIGLSVFLATFNADQYRPLLVKQLEQALHTPVSITRLSLTWRGGIAAQLQGVSVGDAARPGASVQAESVYAVVRLWPLLKKDVQVSTVTIVRPNVTVVRQLGGTITVGGFPSMGTGAPPTPPPSPMAAAAMSVLISSLTIEQGTLHVRDATQTPPLDLPIEQLDATIRNLSLTNPIDFQIRLACWSRQQNLELSGRVRLPAGGPGGFLEHVNASTDLAHLDADAMKRSMPQFAFQESPRGVLRISIERLPLAAQALDELTAHVQLTDGRFPLAALASPLDHVNAEFTAQKDTIELQRFSASLGSGTVSGTGRLIHLSTQPQATMDVTVQQLPLQGLLPPTTPQEPALQGVLGLTFHGASSGREWLMFTQALSGTGQLALTNMKVLNVNVLREVFQRLSILPGLAKTLEARLPEAYQAKFAARDTVFEPMQVALTATQGVLQLQPLQVKSDTFQLDGAGQVRVADGAFEGRFVLRIDAPLSAAIVQSVNELHYISNANGELELPVSVRTHPQMAIVPDVQYVASKILIPKAQDVLTNLLQKSLEKRGATP